MIGLGLVIAGFLVGMALTGLVFGIFSARAYDKGAIDGYEQGKRDGYAVGRGLID